MLLAKLATPLFAVANFNEAPGAMSCTISIIAQPSSAPVPPCPGSTVASAGRSPAAMRAARQPGDALSDNTQTVTPAPLKPVVLIA